MALLPNTPEYREIPISGGKIATRRPISGGKIATRRLIRGVGAAERAMGKAWSSLTSAQRQAYGNPRNFAQAAQRAKENQILAKDKTDHDAQIQAGRDSVTGGQESAGSAAQTQTPSPTGQKIAERRQQQMVEYMGRQYPADIANDRARRTAYDTEIETRLNDKSAVQRAAQYAASEQNRDMYPQGKPGLTEAIKEGRIKDFQYSPEDILKARKRAMSNRQPQYTRDGQVIRDW